MKLCTPERIQLTPMAITKLLLQYQNRAISSDKKVGCIIEGFNYKENDWGYFFAANVELSGSLVYHAEQLALIDCILEGYYPLDLYVTSDSIESSPVFLCGICRQALSEVNMDCGITVISPDGTIKGFKDLKDVCPNWKNVQDKNVYFKKLSGYLAPNSKFSIDLSKIEHCVGCGFPHIKSYPDCVHKKGI